MSKLLMILLVACNACYADVTPSNEPRDLPEDFAAVYQRAADYWRAEAGAALPELDDIEVSLYRGECLDGLEGQGERECAFGFYADWTAEIVLADRNMEQVAWGWTSLCHELAHATLGLTTDDTEEHHLHPWFTDVVDGRNAVGRCNSSENLSF